MAASQKRIVLRARVQSLLLLFGTFFAVGFANYITSTSSPAYVGIVLLLSFILLYSYICGCIRMELSDEGMCIANYTSRTCFIKYDEIAITPLLRIAFISPVISAYSKVNLLSHWQRCNIPSPWYIDPKEAATALEYYKSVRGEKARQGDAMYEYLCRAARVKLDQVDNTI